MLSEINHSQKDSYYMIPLKEVPSIVRFIKTVSGMVVVRD